MPWSEVDDSTCAVARALAVLGDRWTILILRELFLETKRFDDLQALTGASSNLLATRLRRLEDDGVVTRVKYSERPPRHEYHLTPKGRDLEGVMITLRAWGDRWLMGEVEEVGLRVVHAACGAPVTGALVCHACHAPYGAKDLRATFGKAFLAERRARLAAFRERKTHVTDT